MKDQDDDSNHEDRDYPYSKPDFPEIDVDEEVLQSFEEARHEEISEELSPFSKPEVQDEDNETFAPFEVEARKTPKDEQKEDNLVAFQSFEEKYPDISLLKDEEPIRKEKPKVEEPVLQEPIPEVPEMEEPIEEPVQEPIRTSTGRTDPSRRRGSGSAC